MTDLVPADLAAPGPPAEPDAHRAADPSLQALVEASGLTRIHLLAWRDLADPEAGGSEVHADKVAQAWAGAGLDVTMRTAAAAGQRAYGKRNGYSVVRKAGPLHGVPAHRAVRRDRPHRPARRPRGDLERHAVLLPALGALPQDRLPAPRARRDVADGAAAAGSRRSARPSSSRPRRRSTGPRRSSRCRTPAATRSSSCSGMPRAERHRRAARASTRCYRPGGDALAASAGRRRRAAGAGEASRPSWSPRCSRPSRRCPALEAVLVGEGYERDALEAQIRAAGAQDWLRLPGRVSDAELVAALPARLGAHLGVGP